MDFEHSRLIEALAASESTIARLTHDVEVLRRIGLRRSDRLNEEMQEVAALQAQVRLLESALHQMTAVSDHQTGRTAPMVGFAGSLPVPVRGHPLTCGTDSAHGLLQAFWTGTSVALRCPDCAYEQAHVPRCIGGHDEAGDVGC